jgi:putative transposase
MVFFSYHFMDNHIHLTGKVSSLENFSRFFRLVNNLFSKKFNKEHHRYGQTVMQRFLSPRIKDDQHMLAVIAYIDLNSVRAGKHSQPEDSSWSSYKYYAYGQTEPLIEVAPFYLGLGKSGLIRQRRYRELVKIQLFCWW